MTNRNIDERIAELMQLATEHVGFVITPESYRRITAEQATGLLAKLSQHPDLHELAKYQGGIAEGLTWLTARGKGIDLPLDEVSRQVQSLPAHPTSLDGNRNMTDEQVAQHAAEDFLTLAS